MHQEVTVVMTAWIYGCDFSYIISGQIFHKNMILKMINIIFKLFFAKDFSPHDIKKIYRIVKALLKSPLSLFIRQ